jgi:NAD(P)-dependent dehydrogenase (short-subunit alcohol dehydrogenase family)
LEVRGKVAIVTGAGGGGSGRAIAKRLARQGVSVVVNDIDEAGGRETARQIEAERGKAVFFQADVSIESQIKTLIAFAESALGGLDILVHSAGAHFFERSFGKLVRNDTRQLDGLRFRHSSRYRIYAQARWRRDCEFQFHFCAGTRTKAFPLACIRHCQSRDYSLTTTMAWLQEKERIRINCIVPAWIASEEVKEFWEELTPQQRKELGAPAVLLTLDEIADAVLELITNDNLAGRVMVLWNGEPRRLIAEGDPGYAKFE